MGLKVKRNKPFDHDRLVRFRVPFLNTDVVRGSQLRRILSHLGEPDAPPTRSSEVYGSAFHASEAIEHYYVGRVLRTFGVDLVIDVGANIGQYAQKLRAAGYARRIASFEPLTDAHEQLQKNAAGDALWSVYPRTALGSKRDRIEINVSANSYSSSTLPIHAAHLDAAPASRFIRSEMVDQITLDDASRTYSTPGDRLFVKLDVQGLEWAVLQGGPVTIGDAIACQIELSTLPLYQSQQTYGAFLDYFRERDYVLWALWPGFTDDPNGRMLQFDALFVNSRYLDSDPRKAEKEMSTDH